jgi:hypothetical protein
MPRVIAVVSFGAECKPASVSADVLEEIRRIEASCSQRTPGLRSGDAVNLTEGPLKDCRAFILRDLEIE